MSKLKIILTTPIKSIYLSSALLVIAIVLYIYADNKYVPRIILKHSSEPRILSSLAMQPTVSLSTTTQNNTFATVATTSTNIVAFRDELVLNEGLILGISNASGNLSIEARAGLDRCYRLDGYERCFAVQKQTLQDRSSYYTGTFEKQSSDTNPIAKIEASEGSIDFKSIKGAIEWIDSEVNKPFNFIYTEKGFIAGWYKLDLPPGLGSLVKVQEWQLYIDGEKPVMLPGSQRDKFRFEKKAIKISGIVPPILANGQIDPIKGPMKSKQLKKFKNDQSNPLFNEYCHEENSAEYGEHVVFNSEKEVIDIAFADKKNEEIANTLGISFLRVRLDRLIKEKDNINKNNKRLIKDPTKIYVDYTMEAYHVPNDIADWITSKKNILITAKWFRFKDVDYLYLSAGLDGDAIIVNDGESDDVMFKMEALYMFVDNKYSEVIRSGNINILKIEKNSLIIGVKNVGYEGANGKVIAFDGSKSSVICNWGYGL